MSYEIRGKDWLSKEIPKEVSNLRPLTPPCDNSDQVQTLSLDNPWRFECLRLTKIAGQIVFYRCLFGKFWLRIQQNLLRCLSRLGLVSGTREFCDLAGQKRVRFCFHRAVAT
jgi:hypothetical protein